MKGDVKIGSDGAGYFLESGVLACELRITGLVSGDLIL